MATRRKASPATNIWTARIIPLLIIALIGYVSWVITKPICIDYLLSPPASLVLKPQHSAGVAILVIYYILLVLLIVTYIRLLYVVARHPGLVPRGSQYDEETRSSSRTSKPGREDDTTPKETRYLADDQISFNVQDFWKRDVFVCNSDGRPNYCSSCYNWKPDRAHHCSELNRCVLKMDHFCPWVGGIVSETSFKFFIQFTFYAALFTFHILVSTAYFFEQRRRLTGAINGNWIVLLAVSSLFLLFGAGMCGSSLHFALTNSTTIENLGGRSKIWYLAVYMSPSVFQEMIDQDVKLNTITYPLAIQDGIQTEKIGEKRRVFAILQTPPGRNPFNLGSTENFKQVMGYRVWDWFLPFSMSPLVDHSGETLYRMGAVVRELRTETGLKSWSSSP